MSLLEPLARRLKAFAERSDDTSPVTITAEFRETLENNDLIPVPHWDATIDASDCVVFGAQRFRRRVPFVNETDERSAIATYVGLLDGLIADTTRTMAVFGATCYGKMEVTLFNNETTPGEYMIEWVYQAVSEESVREAERRATLMDAVQATVPSKA